MSLKFGLVYFHHLTGAEYVGPRIARMLNASCVQLDMADVSFWYHLHKGPARYDWSLMDQAYAECERNGVEPIPSLAHHCLPPPWVEQGPFNETLVETSEYGRITVPQKAFADFLTAFVERYGDRTQLYVLSHEWNVTWKFYTTMNTPNYERFIRNQIGYSLIAHRIIKRLQPNAELTYGLVNVYRRDGVDGQETTPLHYLVDEYPFGPRFMIQKYAETGNREFLDLLNTMYITFGFYTTGRETLDPRFLDSREPLTSLYKASVEFDGKTYRYGDCIKKLVANQYILSGNWALNKTKFYSQEEESDLLRKGIENILAARARGIPVTHILANATDKNEAFSTYGLSERTRFIPEGMWEMEGWSDHLEQKPTPASVTFKPRAVSDVFKTCATRFAGQR